MTQKPMHVTEAARLRRGRRRRRPHPRAARPVGDLPRARSTATAPCASCSTRTASRSSRSAASAASMSRKGFPSTLGRHGRSRPRRHGARTPSAPTSREAPYGSMDPDERLELLDAEGIDAVVLYTTVGLLWEAELEDVELSQAYTRAYNRWICEFCSDSPRLVPTAHLSLGDPVGGGEGARAGRGRRRPGRVRRAVHPRRPAARPPRQRPRVRGGPGPRRPLRHPPHLRAAVDEGVTRWARGRTCGSSACWRRYRPPTACATSSRRCSTTASSTSSRG